MSELREETLREEIQHFIALFEELDEEHQLLLISEILKSKLAKVQEIKRLQEMAEEKEKEAQRATPPLENTGKAFLKGQKYFN